MDVPLTRLTLREFLTWEDQQPERHEFYRGETFAMVGGTARHNRVILISPTASTITSTTHPARSSPRQ